MHAPQLKRFLRSQVAEASEAEDLMQELYLRVLRMQVRGAIRFPRAYLFRVAVNLVYEHRQRRDAEPPRISLDDANVELSQLQGTTPLPNSPESEAVLAGRLAHLSECLSELPPKVRAAVVWHHRDGYTCQEISERLAVVHHRVKKYLVKGLAHCRGETCAATRGVVVEG
jgi:RNA polymerase sigma-70 factor (ECF subfamily)